MQAKARATMCTLTKAKLSRRVVTCKLGRLFNKEPVVKCLVKKTLPAQFSYIRGLKDIKTLNLTKNRNTESDFNYVCPVTKEELNGFNKFYALWSCGCVFSEKAYKMVCIKVMKCPVCNVETKKKNLISLN